MPTSYQADNKTRPTRKSVKRYLQSIEPAGRREDATVLLNLMSEVTGEEARMWGASIIGFGTYHYRYDSGRQGRGMLVGFAPRKSNLVIYITPGFAAYQDLLRRLGKHKHSVSCLYLGRLKGIDQQVLRQLIELSVAEMRNRYPE